MLQRAWAAFAMAAFAMAASAFAMAASAFAMAASAFAMAAFAMAAPAMTKAMASAIAASALLVMVSCLGPPPEVEPPSGPGLGETTFDVTGDQVPPVPDDFTPPPRLPDPLPGDPRVFGAAYLDQVAAAISPRFSSFLEDLRVRLPPHHAMNDKTLDARLQFVIAADGSLSNVAVVDSSGLAAFDEAAEEILLDSGPLPIPPAEVAGDDDVVRAQWLFARDARAAGVATARLVPVRWPTAQAVPVLLKRGAHGLAAARLAADAELPEAKRRALVSRIARAIASEAAAAGNAEAIAALNPDDARAITESLGKFAATEGAGAQGAAMIALGMIGDPTLEPLARRVVQDAKTPDPIVASAARAWDLLDGAHTEIAQGAAELFESQDPLRRRRAFVIAAAVPLELAFAPASALLDQPDALPLVAPAIARLAKTGNRKAVSLLAKQLGSRVAVTRAAFAFAVASVGGPLPRRIRSRIERNVSDADERVRVASLQTIAAAWPSRVGRSARKLKREQSPLVRLALAKALTVDRSRTATNALKALLEDSDAVVVVAAARGLWGRPGAQALLAGLFESESEAVRAAALPALSESALLALLEGDDQRALLALEARLSLGLDSRASATVIAGQDESGRVMASLTWLAAEKRANLEP